MPKYVVDTISMFRIRYVVEAECVEHANDEVTMNCDGALQEFSQLYLAETISSTREINNEQYLELFDKDNDYLQSWDSDKKLSWVNKIDYKNHDSLTKELDPDQRDWEYDGTGIKVWKGTMNLYSE